MHTIVLIVFATVYLGMILGEIPGLRLDRAGIALLGAIALVAVGQTTAARAWAAVDVNTIALLFGLMIASAQFRLFGFYPWVTGRLARSAQSPRRLLAWVVALAGAGILLTSRHMGSRDVLGLVDWQLLVLFMGLFVVNAAVRDTGLAARGMHLLTGAGLDLRSPHVLFGATAVLSNLVSNVPAVMLLMPAASHRLAGPILALASTFAGNFLIVGSIANIIVVDQARHLGVEVDWRTHARVGIPVTLGTLVLAAGWLFLRSW